MVDGSRVKWIRPSLEAEQSIRGRAREPRAGTASQMQDGREVTASAKQWRREKPWRGAATP